MEPARRLVLLAVVMLSVVVSGPLAGTAQADPVNCGDTVTTNVTLQADVGPCTGDGIIVCADAIVLDLNGHRVVGTDGPLDGGVGVRVGDHDGVTVTNGTVERFDAGITITGGAGNTISAVVARDNFPQGVAADDGDGISISGTSADNNTVVGNSVINNGPFAGISIFGGTASDQITGTVIDDNEVLRNVRTSQTGGIRLENWSWSTTISDNVVRGNALEGIALFADTRNNTVDGNTVEANGFTSETALHRKGDGIRLFPRSGDHVVKNNTVHGNAANGVFVNGPLQGGMMSVPGSTNNQILANSSLGNNAAPTVGIDEGGVKVRLDVHSANTVNDITLVLPPPSPAYDLHDGNPGCDQNVWLGNVFGTALPECTTG